MTKIYTVNEFYPDFEDNSLTHVEPAIAAYTTIEMANAAKDRLELGGNTFLVKEIPLYDSNN